MWGESQKGFRKIKPKRKALASRTYRHVVNQELRAGVDTDPAKIPKKRLRLWSGARLDDAIQYKLNRRLRLNSQPRKSPEARARRRARRSGG